MELYSIASGSSGNSIFAGTSAENTGILLDAGISKKRIEEGLAQRQLSLDQVEAIFITHEHADHISAWPYCTKICDTHLCNRGHDTIHTGNREMWKSGHGSVSLCAAG